MENGVHSLYVLTCNCNVTGMIYTSSVSILPFDVVITVAI